MSLKDFEILTNVLANQQTLNDMRQFDTGATRNIDVNKPDYESFLSPLVIKRFGEYMNKNRIQADGSIREADNWQKGIPLTSYIKSAWRHFLDWWTAHRNGQVDEEAICAVIFNAQGYLHEHLKKKLNENTKT